MQRIGILSAVLLALATALNLPAHGSDQTTDHSAHVGQMIHETRVQDFQLAYHVVDLKKKTTRHLMVYITGPKGHRVEQAKVGFLIKGPDGVKQTLMAAGMKGAFGVDAEIVVIGSYMIKMKAIINGRKLIDGFTYEVK